MLRSLLNLALLIMALHLVPPKWAQLEHISDITRQGHVKMLQILTREANRF